MLYKCEVDLISLSFELKQIIFEIRNVSIVIISKIFDCVVAIKEANYETDRISDKTGPKVMFPTFSTA